MVMNPFRLFCCSSKKNIENTGVYVLKLSNNKYYVGESDDINRRIWVHQNDNGSLWTRRYKPEKRIKSLKNKRCLDELAQTLDMMNMYGIDNVRGSIFTKLTLDTVEKVMAAQLYCELNNLCRRCGGSGHYISNCKDNDICDWVNNFGGKLRFDQTLLPNNIRKCIQCNNDITKLPKNFRYCSNCFKEKGYKK